MYDTRQANTLNFLGCPKSVVGENIWRLKFLTLKATVLSTQFSTIKRP
jgi:hypothetical protein